MCKLSVNVNKIATLRNARGGEVPNLIQVVKDIEAFGADGITVHPRPDERHIRYKDVFDINEVYKTEFNIEGYPNRKFMDLIFDVKPTQVTLVPDPPGVLTSNAGWDTKSNFDMLSEVVGEFNTAGIRTSIFIDTNRELIEYAKKLGANRVELYTEAYATNYSSNRELAVKGYREAADYARSIGLGLNAGHDLSLENLKYFNEQIPFLDEVSIGHALISDALYYGLENVVNMYQNLLIK
ncbi:MAG: pyridoxine 5'-phosphate synthase [Crocinitomicaceae bacterium]|nr:pyridoxine 5'-phosphate synthase [Crocinitomicaceae bacterium]|tara:strand:+ start:2101 stop:2817 length:717 start_codon:yes stop_codon:yes gene_type:complete